MTHACILLLLSHATRSTNPSTARTRGRVGQTPRHSLPVLALSPAATTKAPSRSGSFNDCRAECPTTGHARHGPCGPLSMLRAACSEHLARLPTGRRARCAIQAPRLPAKGLSVVLGPHAMHRHRVLTPQLQTKASCLCRKQNLRDSGQAHRTRGHRGVCAGSCRELSLPF